MENTETANIAVNMIVEDEIQAEQEISAQDLTANLEKPVEEKPAEETKTEEPAKVSEQTRKDAVIAGMTALREEGVTSEELLAFSQDETARKDVQAGKDVVRAFMAYTRRQASAVRAQPEEPAKKGIPTVKAQSTAAAGGRSSIKDMSKKEFAEFSKRAREAAMMGKKVTFK